MFGGGELGREAGAADQLRRRIGRPQLGVVVLERLQLAQQLVELGVGDDRRVPDVVAELVVTHLVGEFLPAAAQIGFGGILGLFGQRLSRLGCLGAHPRRLSEASDTQTDQTARRHLRV